MQSGGPHGRPGDDAAGGARPLRDDADGGDAVVRSVVDGEAGESATDGRTARRIRNEAAVVDAMIELISEGSFDPTAEQIAERAGVSHRSVYRYFSSRTQLIEAVIGQVLDRIAPVVFFDGVGEGTFAERTNRFVQARVEAYAAFGPIARAAFRRAVSDEAVEEAIDAARSMLREQLVEHFDVELSSFGADQRRLVVTLLDATLQYESLEHMTVRSGLGEEELVAALSIQINAILQPDAGG